MKLLIFGGGGMLGHKLVQQFRDKFDVWATVRGRKDEYAGYGLFRQDRTLEGINVNDTAAVRAAIESVRPDVVINAVGIIKQLPSAGDVIKTLEINSIFPHRLAELGREFGFRLICISTDCVFNGEKGNYTEDSVPDAYDLYGKSKNLGEVPSENCLTLRISIIGRELGTSHSLVDWFLGNRGKKVKGFVNAIYSGFPTIVFADIIASLITDHPNLHGLYHISSEPINKFDLLGMVNEYYKAGIEIEADTEFKIDRSLDSTRFRQETGFRPLGWDEMVRRMADDPTPYDKWKK